MVDSLRLPRSIVPTHYELTFVLNPVEPTYDGHVHIRIDICQPTDTIILHAVDLEIASGVFRDRIPTIQFDATTEQCHLVFGDQLAIGSGTLSLRFRGSFNDQLHGLYRCRYRLPSEEWRWFVATHFQPANARRAFPCWDEPEFKATFAICVSVPEQFQVISNAPIASDTSDKGKRFVRFTQTIPLPTYLITILVGEFETEEPTFVRSIPIRVWTVSGKSHLSHFARQVASFSLLFFEQYFNLPYSGQKLDLVALPDFAPIAMENFAALIFRETALLVDETVSTQNELEDVANVIAHEIAHLWFGDLVTIRWWDGLWLQEAFATMLQVFVIETWRPGWHQHMKVCLAQSKALFVDGLLSSYPLEHSVQSAKDAEEMFDSLTYGKGAALLRMLRQYLSPSKFQDCERTFLKVHALGHADTEDFQRALEKSAPSSISQLMHDWIFQAGYPRISVQLQGNKLILAQQRFTYLPRPKTTQEPLWHIPLTVLMETSSGEQTLQLILTEQEQCWHLPNSINWLIVNADGQSFVRVNYESSLYKNLTVRLNRLAPIVRFNLLSDSWANVLAGSTPLSEYLDLTAKFIHDPDPLVWSEIFRCFTILNQIADDEDRYHIQLFIRDRLRPMTQQLGWQRCAGEENWIHSLRSEMITFLGTLGDDTKIHAEAERIYYGNKRSDPEMETMALIVLAHLGDESRYFDFFYRYRNATTPQEEQRYLLALTRFRATPLIERTLTATLQDVYRQQDIPTVLCNLLLNVASRQKTWNFIREHWRSLTSRLSSSGFSRLCEGILGLISSHWEREVREWFYTHQLSEVNRYVVQLLEQLQILVELQRRERQNLKRYLRR